MRVKTLICNCKGLSPFFRTSDMNNLPFEIESDLDVDYAIVHPQLCGSGGNKVLEAVIHSAEDEPDTLVMVGACEAEAQEKLFRKVFLKTGFDQDRFVAVDIRNTTNEGILKRLRKQIEKRACSERKGH